MTPPPSTRPTQVVNFTVRTTRDGVSDLELNILGAATTGTGTYTATGLSATGVDFDGPQGTSGVDLVGRKVTAGLSYGTVASITDSHSLVLTAEGWSAGQPADGSGFSIEAADPKTGAPEFADTLEDVTGIGAANADLSTATVTPDVVVTLPMALDLSAPLTYVNGAGATVPDCDPSSGTAPCPFQQVDASGLGRVISSLPLASDRILLRQSPRDLLVADADITSPVQINTASGFLALSVGGDVNADRPRRRAPADARAHRAPATSRSRRSSSRSASRPSAPRRRPTTSSPRPSAGRSAASIDVSVDDAPDAFADGENSTSLTLEADRRRPRRRHRRRRRHRHRR